MPGMNRHHLRTDERCPECLSLWPDRPRMILRVLCTNPFHSSIEGEIMTVESNIVLYSDNLKALQIIAEGLNQIDKALSDAGMDEVQMKHVPLLFDQEGFGTMIDEIGGSWAWTEEDMSKRGTP